LEVIHLHEKRFALKLSRNSFYSLLLIILILFTQFGGTAVVSDPDYSFSYDDFSDAELVEEIKSSTGKLINLYNEKLGIFVWNVQNPLNLSRYGNLTDLTNSDECLKQLDAQKWLEGLAQDISLQYMILKRNVQIAFDTISSVEEESRFNREWILMTEGIISWIYYRVATNDELIDILSSISVNHDGFSEFWDSLIRPKYNPIIGERVALLPDTLELGAKILRAVEFMPYFTSYERYSILLLSEIASRWWQLINQYALFDPEFAVAGLGDSYLHSYSEKWLGWKTLQLLFDNGTFAPIDVFLPEHQDFQNYLYTSPQIALLYVKYMRKYSAGSAINWLEERSAEYPINNVVLAHSFSKILNAYADHIVWVDKQLLYIFNPFGNNSWLSLDKRFSGYSYVWSKYFIGSQDSNNDLNQYKVDDSPLKKTGLRTFQGAGDIRGLMDIFALLSEGFIRDSSIQVIEEKAVLLLKEILRAKRADNTFLFSPYFGTALDMDIVNSPLINDAELIHPDILPEGLKCFTGTMSVLSFLLNAYRELLTIGEYQDKILAREFAAFQEDFKETIMSIGEFLLSKINKKTMGIQKQVIIGNILGGHETYPYYKVKSVKVTVDLRHIGMPFNELPDWLYIFDSFNVKGKTLLYQWDYLFLLKELFLLFNEKRFIDPAFETLLTFKQDYSEDEQYQLTAICEAKDAVARYFFEPTYFMDTVELCDNTGYFDLIPYSYRAEVLPVTSAFATETPQQVTGLILTVLPSLLKDLFYDPMNRVILIGFLTGFVLTVVVIYLKRPKYQ